MVLYWSVVMMLSELEGWGWGGVAWHLCREQSCFGHSQGMVSAGDTCKNEVISLYSLTGNLIVNAGIFLFQSIFRPKTQYSLLFSVDVKCICSCEIHQLVHQWLAVELK